MKVCILGSGAYGIALSSILSKNKVSINMWTFSEEECSKLNETRISEKLKDYRIPENVIIKTNMEECIYGSDLIVISVPAFAFEDVVKQMKKFINKKYQF